MLYLTLLKTKMIYKDNFILKLNKSCILNYMMSEKAKKEIWEITKNNF